MRYRNLKILIGLVVILLYCFSANANAPKKLTRQEYIDKYAPLAIEQMNEYQIPASITMAQACLESADGNSELTVKSNNHFGIKCKNGWTGPSVTHHDDERDECFRKYSDPLDSFRDHARFLVSSSRYQFLFDYDIKDYKKWATGLKRAGYATDPNYPSKLIKIIEDFQLNELDEYYRSGKLITDYSKTQKGLSNSNSERFSINPYATRRVEKRNGSKAIIAQKGDAFESIALEFGLNEWEIFKYNDAEKGDHPEPNAPVYIQHKRTKAPRGNDIHVVQKGETMRSIAQWYGVKVRSLYSKNKMSAGDEPRPGQQISLRKKIK